MAQNLWGGGRHRAKSWTGGRLAFGRTMHGEHETPNRGRCVALSLTKTLPFCPPRSLLLEPFLLTVPLLDYLAPVKFDEKPPDSELQALFKYVVGLPPQLAADLNRPLNP